MRARPAGLTAAAALLGAGSLTAARASTTCRCPGGAATGSDAYQVTVEFARRARPGAAVGGQGQRRHGRQRRRRSRSTAGTPRVALRLRKTRCTCRTTPSPSCARPACWARSSSRCRRPPTEPPQGRLGDGDTIPLARSGRNPEVEEVLGALSLVLNGGGVAQLKTINVELTQAHGRATRSDIQGAIAPARHLRRRPGRSTRPTIVRALDGLDRLSARLAAQKDDIADGHRQPRPGPEGARRPARAADPDAHRAVRPRPGRHPGHQREPRPTPWPTCGRSQPILTSSPRPATTCPRRSRCCVTYPFPQAATGAVQGDYTNLRITADLDLRDILEQPQRRQDPGLPSLPRCPPVAEPRPAQLPTATLPSVPLPLGRCRRCPLPTHVDRGRCRLRVAPSAWPASASAPAGTAAGAYDTEPGPADDGGPGMIRRGVKLQLVAFARDHAWSGISYVGARYVGLGDGCSWRRATS